MISFAECLDSEFDSKWSSEYNSRFAVGTYDSDGRIFKTSVQTQFLSPGITYTVNLVFKHKRPSKFKIIDHRLIFLEYKLHGETKTSISYLADKREDGWWMCELYQFTSDQRIVDLQIMFGGLYGANDKIAVEGIEFWPLEEEVEHKEEMQPLLDSDDNWEEKLPSDYEDIMKRSTDSVQWAKKKEAYSIICKGFLINDGKEWFSLDKNGKKCQLLSATVAVDQFYGMEMLSLPESRFGEALHCHVDAFIIDSKIQSQLVSSETTYAMYLVYKLPEDQSRFEAPVLVAGRFGSDRYGADRYIYLVSPQTPVIRPKADQNTHNPLNRPKIIGLPQQRKDGWMEVEIWEFQTAATTQMIHGRLQLQSCDGKMFKGLIIEGVEFRPIFL